MNPFAVIGVVFALMVVHELGHAAAARALGLRFRVRFARRPLRLVVGVLFPGDVVPWQDLVIASAGPAVSVAAGVAIIGFSPIAGVSSILIGLLNLLPLRHSDGWRIIRAARAVCGVAS